MNATMAAVPISRSTADRAGAFTAWLLFGVNVGFALCALLQNYGYAIVLMVYRAEAAVIGALNVPKMLVVALFGERIHSFRQLRQAGSRFALTYMLLVGYVAGFAVVCMLLYAAIVIVPVMLKHGDKVSQLQSQRTLDPMTDLIWPIAALALVHVVSFFVNFLWRGEFRGASLLGFALQPVLRVAGIVGVMLLALAAALVQPWAARATPSPRTGGSCFQKPC